MSVNCYYKMNVVGPSTFATQDKETGLIHIYDLGFGHYFSQMRDIAKIIQNMDVETIYVSNKASLPLEYVLNNIRLNEYNQNTNIDFIYKND